MSGENLKRCKESERQAIHNDLLEHRNAEEYWKVNYKCAKLTNKAKEKCMREMLSEDEVKKFHSYRQNKKYLRINGVIKEVIVGTGE